MISKEETKRILQGMKQVIEARGWTQGKFESSAGEVCLMGAYCLYAHPNQPFVPRPDAEWATLFPKDVGAALYKALMLGRDPEDPEDPWRSLVWENDTVFQSRGQVLDALEEAVNKL